MKTAAIICEYNPFHNGHKYHIEQTKKQYGATHIVCVMSGNFTQRGDVALCDKYERARAALKSGADLVLELPVAFSLASAEYFARGAVHIINSLGCVDMLSFGSETGNSDILKEAAGAVHFALDSEDFTDYMKRGLSYPAALKKVVEEYYTSDVVDILTGPNNILGVEYIRALDMAGGTIEPVTVKRYGAAHDSEEISRTVSASKLRKMIRNGEDVTCYTDFSGYENYAVIERLETAILAKLRTMTKSDFEKLPNGGGGIENRMVKAARTATTLPQLMLMIKSKNFTMSRIRRLILCAFLGITKNDLKNMPSYIRILGMNDKGKEILSAAKECPLPIDTSLSALSKTSDIAGKQARLEERAGNMYALALEKRKPCGTDFTAKPIIIKEND
ncbi:MAG: nucleotidyltransferase family protein [Ruminiclostridium sp.]|nr:nucleotidyltransferase family protein [Ruminiclostridium sp.]